MPGNDTFETRYEYYNGRVSTGYLHERANLGFEKIKRTDVNSGNYTITTYRQDKPFHGTPLVTRSYLANGTLVSEQFAPSLAQYLCTDAGCSPDPANTPHPALPRQFRQTGPTVTKTYENALLRQTRTEQVLRYDSYGNPELSLLRVASGSQMRVSYTFRRHINLTDSNRVIGLVYSEKTCLTESECSEGDAAFVAASRYYYDNYPFGQAGARHLMTRKETYGPMGDSHGWIAETFAYNNLGQVEDHRATNGIRTETVYDAEFKSLPASVYISDGTRVRIMTYLYDYRFGKVRYSSDSESGIAVDTLYDPSGRVVEKVTRQQAVLIAKTTYQYSAPGERPAWARECTHYGAAFTETKCTTRFTDALGRTFREEFPEFVNGENKQMAIERRFDALGREVQSSRPFAAEHSGCSGTATGGGNPALCQWSTTVYDDFNRVTQSIALNGKTTRYTYPTEYLPYTSVAGTITEGSDGRKKGEFQNIFGKIAVSYAALHDTTRVKTVRYHYDALARLVTVDAPTGATVITYVGASNWQKSIYDPVAGLTEYEYYTTPGVPSYGKLKSEKRGGYVTNFEYNAGFGRVSRMTRANLSDSATILEEIRYSYDETDKPNGRGRLTTLKHIKDGFTLEERYSYDARGEVVETVRRISHATETLCADQNAIPCLQVFGRSKDELGRVREMLYPDGTRTQVEYTDSFSPHIARLTHEGTVYATYDQYTYDVAPHVGRVRYNNGLTHTYTYAEDAGLLRTARVSSASGDLMHLQYAYDEVYNIRYIEDKVVPSLSMRYEYDAHNRIRQAIRGDGHIRMYRFDHADGADSAGKLELKHNRRLEYAVGKTYPVRDEVLNPETSEWQPNQSFTWSATGNLLTKGPFSFSYDASSMMVRAVEKESVSSDTTVAETKFFYDHTGQRFLKTHLRNGVMIKTWYLGDGIELREKYVGVTSGNPTGTFEAYQTTKYIYGIDDKKIASITGLVKTTPPAATGDSLYALAGTYSSQSISGLSLKVYYTLS